MSAVEADQNGVLHDFFKLAERSVSTLGKELIRETPVKMLSISSTIVLGAVDIGLSPIPEREEVAGADTVPDANITEEKEPETQTTKSKMGLSQETELESNLEFDFDDMELDTEFPAVDYNEFGPPLQDKELEAAVKELGELASQQANETPAIAQRISENENLLEEAALPERKEPQEKKVSEPAKDKVAVEPAAKPQEKPPEVATSKKSEEKPQNLPQKPKTDPLPPKAVRSVDTKKLAVSQEAQKPESTLIVSKGPTGIVKEVRGADPRLAATTKPVPSPQSQPTSKKRRADDIVCCGLCPSRTARDESLGKLVGPLHRRRKERGQSRYYFHKTCFWWSPQAYIYKENRKKSVLKNKTCDYCGENNASIPCAADNCGKYFHYVCLEPASCVAVPSILCVMCATHKHLLPDGDPLPSPLYLPAKMPAETGVKKAKLASSDSKESRKESSSAAALPSAKSTTTLGSTAESKTAQKEKLTTPTNKHEDPGSGSRPGAKPDESAALLHAGLDAYRLPAAANCVVVYNRWNKHRRSVALSRCKSVIWSHSEGQELKDYRSFRLRDGIFLSTLQGAQFVNQRKSHKKGYLVLLRSIRRSKNIYHLQPHLPVKDEPMMD